MDIKAKIPAFAGMTYSSLFRHLFYVFFICFYINSALSQDTGKTQSKPIVADTSLSAPPVTFILSDFKYQLINRVNPDTLTRRRFLWYPLKNTEDVFNYLPGYYLNYMDVGQFNPVSFNQMPYYNTAVLRNGRPINDYDGSVDLNLFSRNEITGLELSGGFGNIMDNYTNAVSVIQRQIFQNRPFTEISFVQDRYENLFFDANYTQTFWRRLNFGFGVTKHSYDGKYTNSDFDKWLGRWNLNYAPTSKLNFFGYLNYAKIQKGLNEGIRPDTVNLGIKDEVFDPDLAIVVNSDAYEIKERFDADAGAVFTIGNVSYSKIQLYTTNSFRRYRDEENRVNSNGFFFASNSHWIDYGVKLQQIFNFTINKKFEVISRSEGEFNKTLREQSLDFGDTNILTGSTNIVFNNDYERYSYFSDLSVGYKGFNAQGFIKGYTVNFTRFSITGGVKGSYTYKFDSLKYIDVYAQYNQYNDYFGGGLKLKYRESELSANYYNYRYQRPVILIQDIGQAVRLDGMNVLAKLRLYKFDLIVNYSANFYLRSEFIPKHFATADLCWHDMAFRNKLEYKIGVASRGWSKYKASFFDGLNNGISGSPNVVVNGVDISIPQNATFDFYIMGRIGRATFGVTLENILDRVIYNTGVYPFMDRGGLANVISRFNLTWNFFD